MASIAPYTCFLAQAVGIQPSHEGSTDTELMQCCADLGIKLPKRRDWDEDESLLSIDTDMLSGDSLGQGMPDDDTVFPEIVPPTNDDPPDLVIAGIDMKAKGDRHSLQYAARTAFERKMERAGLVLQRSPGVIDKNVRFMVVRATWEFLAAAAEKLELKMAVAPNDILSESSSFARRITCTRKITSPSPRSQVHWLRIPYKAKLHKYYVGHENLKSFFSPAQRAEIIKFELERLTVTMNRSLNYDAGEGKEDSKTADERISFTWLENRGIYNSMYIPHDSELPSQHPESSDKSTNRVGPPSPTLRKWLRENWASYRKLGVEVPLFEVKEYLGSRQGFYFAWLETYTKMLSFPAIIGLLLLICGIPMSYSSGFVRDICAESAKNVTMCRNCPALTCEYRTMHDNCVHVRIFSMFDNTTTIVYSVFISLWAVVFLEVWNRKEASLSAEWLPSDKLVSDEILRPDYMIKVSTMRKNPVTGEDEPYVRGRARVWKTFVTFLSMLTIVALVITVVFFLIVFSVIWSQMAATTGLFGPSPEVIEFMTALCTSFLHLLFINVSESMFFPFAKKLSNWELHRTEQEYQKALTNKVVTFQFLNYYALIFYDAFVAGKRALPPHEVSRPTDKNCGPQGCLRKVMVQLFVVMTLRQVILNFFAVLKPILNVGVKRIKTFRKRKGKEMSQWEKDYRLPVIDEPAAFHEYAERVIQYGFITMFSPAFPLCALFAWINNMIVMRLHAKKYLVNHRRPVPMSVKDIGEWRGVMSLITKMSIMVNAVLLAFNSIGLELIFVDHIAHRSRDSTVLQYMFTTFDTSHYESLVSKVGTYREYAWKPMNMSIPGYIDALRTWGNETVEKCFFKGRYQNPTGRADGYEHTTLQTNVIYYKLAFVFILQNFAMLMTEVTRAYLSRSESSQEEATKQRESFINRQLIMKAELEEINNSSRTKTPAGGKARKPQIPSGTRKLIN